MLVAMKRLELDRDLLVWIRQALAAPRTELLALSPEIAVSASRLPADFGADPADRMIAAAALEAGAAVVSKDARLKGLPGLKTVW